VGIAKGKSWSLLHGQGGAKLGCTWRVLVTWHCQVARIDLHSAQRAGKSHPPSHAAIRRIQAPELFLPSRFVQNRTGSRITLGSFLSTPQISDVDAQLQQHIEGSFAGHSTFREVDGSCARCNMEVLVLSYPTTPPPLQPTWLRAVYFWRQRVQMTPRVFSLAPLVGPGCPKGIKQRQPGTDLQERERK
jgi:hypothetical protein